MSNSLTYKILYYLNFILTIIVGFSSTQFVTYFNITTGPISVILGLVNVILVIIFSLLLIKRKLSNINVLFPIIYLLFLIAVIIIAVLYNSKLIIPYVHFNYYISFILFNYILLNLYSILSFVKKY